MNLISLYYFVELAKELHFTNTAQKLYTKYGFKPEGFRKNYYKDTNEDAVIMWKYFENYEEFENV